MCWVLGSQMALAGNLGVLREYLFGSDRKCVMSTSAKACLT